MNVVYDSLSNDRLNDDTIGKPEPRGNLISVQKS
jgi:hypothetical protein